MSPRSERAEMHLAILRGVALIRAIEIAHENEAQQLLEAKQELVELIDDDDESGWAPLPHEIEAACAEINACWSDEERERRWRFERQYTPTRLKRYYADALNDRPARCDNRSERNRRYREKHRAQILAKAAEKRSDPGWAAAQRERERLRAERHQLARKERRHEQRDRVNEQNRAWRAAHREHVNAQAAAYREKRRQAKASA